MDTLFNITVKFGLEDDMKSFVNAFEYWRKLIPMVKVTYSFRSQCKLTWWCNSRLPRDNNANLPIGYQVWNRQFYLQLIIILYVYKNR